MMNKLQEYIQWAREHMSLGKTSTPVEPQVQEVKTVYVDVSGKENRPARKPRKKKINLNNPSLTTMDVKND